MHHIIKQILKQRGNLILSSTAFVNCIDDEGGFYEIEKRPYKKIFRGIVKEGYAHKLLEIGEWNAEAEALAYAYAQQNMLQVDSSLYAFSCLAYGLGWLQAIKSFPPMLQIPQALQESTANVNFVVDKPYVFPSIPITLSWFVKDALIVELNGVRVETSGSKTIEDGIQDETTFVLKVTNNKGEMYFPIKVKMLPFPHIQSIVIPTPNISTSVTVNAMIPSPVVNLNLPQPELHSLDLLHHEIYDLKVNTIAMKIPQVVEPSFSLRIPSLLARAKSQINKIIRNYGK